MKKPFLYGFRSKRDWALNRAILLGVLIMFAVIRVGRADSAKSFAKHIPLVWKYLALIVMLSVSAYTCREIYRGILNRALPRMNPGWLAFEVMTLFAFAAVSADQQTIFCVGGILWAAIVFGTERYYSRKWKRAHHEGDVP